MLRVIHENRDELSVMEVAVQQLDSIIDFASLKSSIIKDLKQALLRLHKSMLAAKQNLHELIATATAAVSLKLKVPKSTETEVFAFAGSLKDTPAAIT